MKKYLLLAGFLFAGLGMYGQTVNNVPLKDIDVEYVLIVGTSKFMSTKVTIEIDFGQRTKLWSAGKETILRDEKGDKVEFNSMIDALNFMSANGFEFVDAYAITTGNQNVYHFLMHNKKNKT